MFFERFLVGQELVQSPIESVLVYFLSSYAEEIA